MIVRTFAAVQHLLARCVLGGALLLCVAVGQAQVVPDDARESRWADEVAPQVVVGDAVWLATPQRARVLALYTQAAGKSRGALVLVHGLGVHPDWGVTGALRVALSERGFATLSVQMPVLAADATRASYPPLFPLAADRPAAAVAWLRAKGETHVGVVSHSLGAVMTDAFLGGPARSGVDAWVLLGMPAAFTQPPRVPTLDIVAERDLPEVLAAAQARAPGMPGDACSRRVTIPGADHYFGNATTALADAITPFAERVFGGRCT